MKLLDSIVTTAVGVATAAGGVIVIVAGFLTGIGAPAGAMVGIPLFAGSLPVITNGVASIIENVTQDDPPRKDNPPQPVKQP